MIFEAIARIYNKMRYQLSIWRQLESAFLFILFIVPLFVWPADKIGWLLLYSSFLVVAAHPSCRQDGRLLLVIWLGLMLHQLISLCNAYILPVIGGDGDALDFFRTASEISINHQFSFYVGSSFYASALAIVYEVCGSSLLLGQELSILAFILSCFVLLDIYKKLNYESHSRTGLLIYVLSPTIILFTTFTLREGWQILFFMLVIRNLVKYQLDRSKIALLFATISAFCMGLLHNGLLVYALILIVLGVFWRTQRAQQRLHSNKRAWGLALALILGAGSVIHSGALTSGAMQAVMQGDATKYAKQYRKTGEHGARAEYGVNLNTSSFAGLAVSVPVIYINYLLAPFPWQISAPIDILATLLNMLEFTLLLFSIKAFRQAPKGQRQVLGFLLTQYFLVSLLWSLGTINYGTAIRHHVTHFWLALVMGSSGLVEFVKTKMPVRACAC